MKTNLLLILSMFAVTGIVAQTEVEVKKEMKVVVANGSMKDTTIKGNQDDTLHIRVGDMKIDIYPDSTSKLATGDRKRKTLPLEEFSWYGFSGFRFGFLTFMDDQNKSYDAPWMNNKGRNNSSSMMGFNVVNSSFEIAKDRFRLSTGMGVSLESIALNREVRLSETDTLGFQLAIFPQTEKSNLNANYITVPMVFQYNGKITEKKKMNSGDESNVFHMSFGVVGGYLIGSNAFYKWKENGEKRKQRVAGDFGLNEFMANLYVDFGFSSGLSFFIESALLPKFSSGKGPEIYSNAFGLKLNF